MAKTRAAMLGGRFQRRGKGGIPHPVFDDDLRDKVWTLLHKISSTPLSQTRDKRDTALDAIEDAFALYVGLSRGGSPPTEESREKAFKQVRKAAARLIETVDVATPDQLAAIDQLTDPALFRKKKTTGGRGPDLSLLRRQIDALFDPYPAERRGPWTDALWHRADKLAEKLIALPVGEYVLLNMSFRRTAERQPALLDPTLRNNLGLLLDSDMSLVRLPKAAMDQPGDRLIADLALIWHDVLGRPPVRRMHMDEMVADELFDDDELLEMDEASYNDMIDRLSEMEEDRFFGVWIVGMFKLLGAEPPRQRRVRRIAALQPYPGDDFDIGKLG